METLTKKNFWDEMEQKYPKAMKHFKEWIDNYKTEHGWNGLFSCTYGGEDRCPENLPKYHELPIAMQFGIFIEYLVYIYQNILPDNVGFKKLYHVKMDRFCRLMIPEALKELEIAL